MKGRCKRSRRSYLEDENGNLVTVPKIRKKQKTTLTRPHRVGIRICESLGLNWEVEVKFGRYSVDIYLKDYNVAVEIDGDYWNNLPGVPEKDAKRDMLLKSKYNITTLRFKESELYANPHMMEASLASIMKNVK